MTDTHFPAGKNTPLKPQPGQTQWWTGDPESLPLMTSDNPHPDLLVMPGVLNRAQCQQLIDCFERRKDDSTPKKTHPFWAGRYILQRKLPAAEADVLRLMQQIRLLSQILITNKFLPIRPLYSDTSQVVRWDIGYELRAHVDNLEPDGRPNGTPHRSHSVIMYLNDDYDGGQTFFPGLGVRLKVEPGTLIGFDSGPDYVHGVTGVTRGVRYTYAGWFTHDTKRIDGTMRVIY